jgi:hypothetical protein
MIVIGSDGSVALRATCCLLLSAREFIPAPHRRFVPRLDSSWPVAKWIPWIPNAIQFFQVGLAG